jgi:hypothetical protein
MSIMFRLRLSALQNHSQERFYTAKRTETVRVVYFLCMWVVGWGLGACALAFVCANALACFLILEAHTSKFIMCIL